MCTVINISGECHFFGRTLDMAISPGESVAVVPRRFPLSFGLEGERERHFAFVGTAHVRDGVPLMYDAVNEHGLCCAALRFADSCVYSDKPSGRVNLYSFEVIPYVMAKFSSVREVKEGLRGLCLVSAEHSSTLPETPLHYIISDKEGSVIIESTVGGVSIYDAKLGVLTNSPEYPVQLAVSRSGAIFDPLDVGSCARFCKGARLSEKCAPTTAVEMSKVMGAVGVARGLGSGADKEEHRTVYISVIDSLKLEYTLLHELCPAARTVSLLNEALDTSELKAYELSSEA